MTNSMPPILLEHEGLAIATRLAQSTSPVERELAILLTTLKPSEEQTHRLERYQRKIDIARQVYRSYDAAIRSAQSLEQISSEGYGALTIIFLRMATEQGSGINHMREKKTRWVNSACYAWDHIKDIPLGSISPNYTSIERHICRTIDEIQKQS